MDSSVGIDPNISIQGWKVVITGDLQINYVADWKWRKEQSRS